MKAIAGIHARLKVELGRFARTHHRWDELVRQAAVLDAMIERVRGALVPMCVRA